MFSLLQSKINGTNFLDTLNKPVSEAVNLPVWAVILVAIILLAIVIVLIKSSSAKRKAKKADPTEKKCLDEKPKEENKPAPAVKPEKKEISPAPAPQPAPIKEEIVEETPVQPIPVAPEEQGAQEEEKETITEEVVEDDSVGISDDVTPIPAAPEEEIDNKKKVVDAVKAPTSVENNQDSEPAPVEPEIKHGTIVKPKKLSPRKRGLIEVTETEERKPIAAKFSKKVEKIQNDDSNIETFGKFVLIKDKRSDATPFKFQLLANNGQLLFESEGYKIKPRKSSIDAFRKHVESDNFIIDEDKQGNFRYKLFKEDGRTLLGVGESYKTKDSCESAIESVKNFSKTANLIEDQTEI